MILFAVYIELEIQLVTILGLFQVRNPRAPISQHTFYSVIVCETLWCAGIPNLFPILITNFHPKVILQIGQKSLLNDRNHIPFKSTGFGTLYYIYINIMFIHEIEQLRHLQMQYLLSTSCLFMRSIEQPRHLPMQYLLSTSCLFMRSSNLTSICAWFRNGFLFLMILMATYSCS